MKTRKKRSDEYTEKVQVTDVFDKGPTKEEIAAEKVKIEKGIETEDFVEILNTNVLKNKQILIQKKNVFF